MSLMHNGSLQKAYMDLNENSMKSLLARPLHGNNLHGKSTTIRHLERRTLSGGRIQLNEDHPKVDSEMYLVYFSTVL